MVTLVVRGWWDVIRWAARDIDIGVAAGCWNISSHVGSASWSHISATCLHISCGCSPRSGSISCCTGGTRSIGSGPSCWRVCRARSIGCGPSGWLISRATTVSRSPRGWLVSGGSTCRATSIFGLEDSLLRQYLRVRHG